MTSLREYINVKEPDVRLREGRLTLAQLYFTMLIPDLFLLGNHSIPLILSQIVIGILAWIIVTVNDNTYRIAERHYKRRHSKNG